jgi:hypothetical protein
VARPSAYSDELAVEIATRVALGEGLRSISESEGMPPMRTLIRWTADHPRFDLMLAQARCIKADQYVDEAVPIADEPAVTLADAARNRLRVQARLDAAAKLNPRRYGAKLGIGGAPELPPLEPAMSPFEIARRISFVLALGLNEAQEGPSPAADNERTSDLIDVSLRAH